MALSGKKQGRPKKAGRPRKSASRMRDAQASRPTTLAGLAERESKKKAGGKKKGGGGGMPSIFETLAITGTERKTFADAVGVKSIDDLREFVSQFESENKESLTKGRARGMQLGAAWAAATAPGGFIERMKIPHEEAARRIGYHVQSLRLDARVFRRRHDVPEAVSLYEMHKDEIAFGPRKNDGIDYDRDCLRLLDAARKQAGKTEDGKQRNEPTVADLVAARTALVSAGGTRQTHLVSNAFGKHRPEDAAVGVDCRLLPRGLGAERHQHAVGRFQDHRTVGAGCHRNDVGQGD
jgi:hypothetical protein